MHLENIQNLIQEHPQTTNLFKKNLVKEYLQILILSFIYGRADYQDLVFYGGSCLKHCYGLPRLSEDLDFVDTSKEVNLKKLANELKKFLFKQLDIAPLLKVQKFRIYLKLPLLKKLELADRQDSDLLFLKVEIFKQFDFCVASETQIIPIFKNNQTILVKSFDLPTLMAAKIRAVLNRQWEKTDKQGKVLVRAKGRDYYDLMWYLQKGIKPNLDCLLEITNLEELKKKLLDNINKLDDQSIKLDLEALIVDQNLINDLSKNIKNILQTQIKNW